MAHAQPATSSVINRRALTLALIFGCALLTVLGVLGWTAPARAVVVNTYAIDCPGSIMEDSGGTTIWVSCGSRHSIKQIAKSNPNAIIQTINLTTDVDPGDMVQIGTTIWAVDTNATNGGQLVKVSNGVPTYYTISQKQQQKIATDGTYIFVNGFQDRVYGPDDNTLFRVNQSGTVVNTNTLGSVICGGVPCEWDNVKSLTVENAIYGENIVWAAFTGTEDGGNLMGMRATDLSTIKYCHPEIQNNGVSIDGAVLNGTNFDAIGTFGIYSPYRIAKINPASCTILSATRTDVGGVVDMLLDPPIVSERQSFVLSTSGTSNYITLGRLGPNGRTDFDYSSFLTETTRINPLSFIQTFVDWTCMMGNYFVTTGGGNLVRYQFCDENMLEISGPTVNPLHATDATINWGTYPRNSDSLVQYGLTSAYGTNVYNSTYEPNHTQFISSLIPSTTYHYKVTSCNGYKCVSSDDHTFTTLNPDFSFAMHAEVSVPYGTDAVFQYNVTALNDFTATVSVSRSGTCNPTDIPSGAYLNFPPTPFVPLPAPGTFGTVTIDTGPSGASVGTYNCIMRVTGGGKTHDAPYRLIVTEGPDFTFTMDDTKTVAKPNNAVFNFNATALYNFSSQVSFTLLSGCSISSSYFGYNPNNFVPAASPGTNGTITINTNSLAIGTYTCTMRLSGGGKQHDEVFTLILQDTDFTFAITNSPQTVPQGLPATFNYSVEALNGWNTPVNLTMITLDGIPPDHFAINPTTCSTFPCTGTITVQTDGLNVGASPFDLVARGTGGSKTHNANFQLILQNGPDFTISSTAPSQTILPGGSTSYPIHLQELVAPYIYPIATSQGTISPAHGGHITSVTFNPTIPIQAAPYSLGNVTVTVSTDASLAPGSYTIPIIGTGQLDSNGRTHTQNLTLIVSTPAFALDAYKEGSPPTEDVTVQQGTPARWDVKLDSLVHWGGQIDLWGTHTQLTNFISFEPAHTTPRHGLATLLPDGTTTAKFIVDTTSLYGDYWNIRVDGKNNVASTPVANDTGLNLHVTNGPDFAITATPTPQNGSIPGNVTYTVNLKETAQDYTWPVALTLDSVVNAQTGLACTAPCSITGAFVPPGNQVPGDMSGAGLNIASNITIAAGTPAATYNLTYKAEGQGDNPHRIHNATVQLVLQPVDFLISALPATQNVQVGSTPVTATITLNLKDLPVDGDLDYIYQIDLIYLGTTPSSSITATNLPVARYAAEGAGTDYPVLVNIPAGTTPGTYTVRFKGHGYDPNPGGTEHEPSPQPQLNITVLDNIPPVQNPTSIHCHPDTNAITVDWTTDEPALGTLYSGTTNPPSTAKPETGSYRLTHSVTQDNLVQDTNYYYQVKSCDDESPPNCSAREPSPAAICRTTIVVDNTPPNVAWITPQNGANLSGTAALQVSATDASGIRDVVLLRDGQPTGITFTSGNPPLYNASWDTRTVANGPYTLTASATDMADPTNTGTASINVTVTNDTGAPVCSNFDYDRGANSMTLTWQTNEVANSIVYYCRIDDTPPYDPETCGNCSTYYGPGGDTYCYRELNATLEFSHNVFIGPPEHVLVPGDYRVRAESCDAGGNCGSC